MTLTEFLDLLIPEGGFRFIQYGPRNPGGTRGCKTNQGLADIIEELDAGGTQVWFSPVRYAERVVTIDGKQKHRCQENAEYMQALWLDIDAGKDKHAKGQGYLTQDDALAAVDDFCTVYKLPAPMKVSSGYGLHCYWPLTAPIRANSWLKLARILKSMTKAYGLLADPARTCDSASLMRPITAHNLKNPDYPQQVELLALHEVVSTPTDMANLLLPYADAKPVSLGAPPKRMSADINADLALPAEEYPDVDADQLAEGCAQIRFFRDTGSNEYNHWFRSIGVVKHCVDGEAKCHEWGSRSPEYTHKETQFKIDEWKTGPSTCAAFEDYNGLCAGCQHNGKIASPIRLGFVNKTTVEIPADDVVFAEGVEAVPVVSVELPEPFSVTPDGKQLQVTVRKMVKPPKGSPPGTPPTWDEDTFPWCDIFFYPADRIEDEDGQMQQRIRAKVRGKWKELTVPTYMIGSGGSDLRKELARYEIVVAPKYRQILEEYVVAFTNKLREMKDSIQSYRTFGWQSDGSFVTGNKVFSPEGVRPVVFGGGNAVYFAKHLTPRGSAEAWIDTINTIYNHENHEQYQFVLYSGMGSILAKTFNLGASVLSLYGGKGQGKTTVVKAALSAFGNPEKMSNTWGSGATFKANVVTASVLNSLPYLMDELSNADPQQLSQAAYTFANANRRTGVRPDQTLITGGDNWANTTFFTTNTSLHDILTTAKEDAGAELSRILELNWTAKSAMTKNEVLELYPALLDNAGAAGEQLIQYVVEHQDECKALYMSLLQRIDKGVGFTSEYRFWSQILSATLAGGYIATKLGIFKFDFSQVYQYAISLGKRHMAKVPSTTSSPVESFHAMLTSFAHRLITTPHEVDPLGTTYDTKIVGEPAGRIITHTGEAYIAINAIKDWCAKRCVGVDRIRESMQQSGALINADVRFYIGRGTKLSTGQMRCWKIDWTKIMAGHNTATHLQLVK